MVILCSTNFFVAIIVACGMDQWVGSGYVGYYFTDLDLIVGILVLDCFVSLLFSFYFFTYAMVAGEKRPFHIQFSSTSTHVYENESEDMLLQEIAKQHNDNQPKPPFENQTSLELTQKHSSQEPKSSYDNQSSLEFTQKHSSQVISPSTPNSNSLPLQPLNLINQLNDITLEEWLSSYKFDTEVLYSLNSVGAKTVRDLEGFLEDETLYDHLNIKPLEKRRLKIAIAETFGKTQYLTDIKVLILFFLEQF